MNQFSLTKSAGWSAILTGFATIFGFIALIAFFSLGDPFGILNDIASLIVGLGALPILWYLHNQFGKSINSISLSIFAINLLALPIAVIFQTLLIFRVISYEQTSLIVPVAFGLFGLGLIFYSVLSFQSEQFAKWLSIFGILAGIGYVLIISGFILGGPEHPLSAIGGVGAVVCYPIWAFWFGRNLLSK